MWPRRLRPLAFLSPSWARLFYLLLWPLKGGGGGGGVGGGGGGGGGRGDQGETNSL